MTGCKADGELDGSQFSKPLPWIGLYVAGASLLCAVLMALDTFAVFRHRKPWFPSKFFCLNAATLTLLGVATKLPVDLNTTMPGRWDQLTKLSGTVLICTVMANVMPSLGVTDDNASNITALAILVLTVTVNIGIQMGTGVIYVFLVEHAIIMFFMLLLLAILISSSLPIPTTKEILEQQFDSKHNQLQTPENFTVALLKELVDKYWLMAHTSSPQYVLGRSVTSTASGVFCFLSAVVLIEAGVRSHTTASFIFCNGNSDYKWSTIAVFFSQAVAVFLGTIAPVGRCLGTITHRSDLEGSGWSITKELKVEEYWVKRLAEWKEAPLSILTRHRWTRKVIYKLRNLTLVGLTTLQRVVVVLSKLVHLLGTFVAFVLIYSNVCYLVAKCLSFQNRRGGMERGSNEDIVRGMESGSNGDLQEHVLHLEGEDHLVQQIIRSGQRDTEKWIKTGNAHQPTCLRDLIKCFSSFSQGFNGSCRLPDLDGSTIASLVTEEPPNCWALTLVTLTSIAVGCLGILEREGVGSLVKGVGQSLKYVRLVEKQTDAKGLVNMSAAAETIWTSVDIHRHWLGVDLRTLSLQRPRVAMTQLRETAQNLVVSTAKLDQASPLDYPPKILAANCMYRITDRALGNRIDDLVLLSWLRGMIADVLGACLTNLMRAIYMECICSRVEMREETVRETTVTLGEVEEILKLLEIHHTLYPAAKQYLDEWMVGSDNPPDHPPTSSITSIELGF